MIELDEAAVGPLGLGPSLLGPSGTLVSDCRIVGIGGSGLRAGAGAGAGAGAC